MIDWISPDKSILFTEDLDEEYIHNNDNTIERYGKIVIIAKEKTIQIDEFVDEDKAAFFFDYLRGNWRQAQES